MRHFMLIDDIHETEEDFCDN